MTKSRFKGRRSFDKELGHYYRSGLERSIAGALKRMGVPFQFESYKIEYSVPKRVAKYNPDFTLPNGIIVEAKGQFVTKDRQKHLLIKEQHPDLDIRFVFNNPDSFISPKSRTTYGMWCDKNGFLYARNYIPKAWIDEKAKT